MKKNSYSIFWILWIILIIVTFTQRYCELKSKTYSSCGIITEINTSEDYFVIQTPNGNLWYEEGIEDWQINDICAMIMNDNGTKNIFDDKIQSIMYCGHKE